LDCFKEGLINFVAFGALKEVVAHFRKKLVHFFSGKLKIHVARKDLEEFRAEHFLGLDGADASD
jgi:hypothetical protein